MYQSAYYNYFQGGRVSYPYYTACFTLKFATCDAHGTNVYEDPVTAPPFMVQVMHIALTYLFWFWLLGFCDE